MIWEINIVELTAQLNRPDHAVEIDRYLQSFDKRGKYCDIYYTWFNERLDKKSLLRDRLGIETGTRLEYEAIAVAFVANIHAMIDSVPWFIFQVLEPLSYPVKGVHKPITNKTCRWDENFSAALSAPHLLDVRRRFDELRGNKNFNALKKMSNSNKHSYMSRIANEVVSLRFEILDPATGAIILKDCKEFFEELHDNLVPQTMDLLLALGVARKAHP